MPFSLHEEVYQNIGDHFTYCLKTESPKKYKDLRYPANSCQIKYRMRAIASFNKLAGFPKLSGYKNANLVGPTVIGLDKQIAKIIERAENTFEEIAETRKQVLRSSPPAEYGL